MDRRSFLRNTTFATAGFFGEDSLGVPWSAGTDAPRHKAPENATDCHHHIYDSRFPVDSKAKLKPGDATVAEYRLLQRKLGTTRNVIVQPSTYGTDNRCLMDALRQFGSKARGIAVVHPDISNAELGDLAKAGVCGIRFNLVQAGATTLDMIAPLAKRIAELGWHVQVNAQADQIVSKMDLWMHLPVPVVFDHLCHFNDPHDARFGIIGKLLQTGKCWVKLSGAYMETKTGPPNYEDSAAVMKVYIKEAPERLVWGTDWPHPTTNDKPDDALLFDLAADCSARLRVWSGILVANPQRLYQFG